MGNGDLTGAAEQAVSSQAAAEERPPVPASWVRRLAVVAGWVVGCLALTALFVRISLSARVMSDGATIALQSFDLLHGHLLLHGWQVSDLNCYFVELPVIAFAEGLFGLGDFAQHVGSSLTYMLVAVVAMAAAMTGSRGAARAVRCGDRPRGAGGTALRGDHVRGDRGARPHRDVRDLIGSFLLIDRFPGRRFTAPLLLVILTAGQFDDLTVRYFAVPAIVAVCAYHALAARRFRSPGHPGGVRRRALSPRCPPCSAGSGCASAGSSPRRYGRSAPRSASGRVMSLVTWGNTRILYGAGNGVDRRAGSD